MRSMLVLFFSPVRVFVAHGSFGSPCSCCILALARPSTYRPLQRSQAHSGKKSVKDMIRKIERREEKQVATIAPNRQGPSVTVSLLKRPLPAIVRVGQVCPFLPVL